MSIFDSMEPAPDEVRAQLSRMLGSKDFKVPKRLKTFFSFVVEETLSGNENNIKAYTIATTAFGRGAGFDAQLDPIVRIEAGKLRKALEIYFYAHPEDEVQILIPKGSYVPIFSYSSSKTQPQEILDNVIPEPEKPQEAAVPVLDDSPFVREKRPVMMVIPFSMRNHDEDLGLFLSGLMDNLFVQIQDNEVVDVMEAPLQHIPNINQMNAVQFAKENGVRFVLHGQAQTSDTSIRLYVALTDAKEGLRIWSEKYDCPFSPDSYLSVQDQISRNIFSTVLDSIGVISRTLVQETSYLPLAEHGVYESTLRFVDWVTSFDKRSHSKARQALELNVAKDPHNSILLSYLSDIYSSDYQFAFNQVPNNLDSAFELAKRALISDPTCHMAKLAKALYFFLIKDKQQLNLLLKDLPQKGNVNPYVRASVGLYIGMSGDLEEGKDLIEKAISSNPYQPSSYNVVPFMYHFSKKEYEEALRFALLINAPFWTWDPLILAVAYTAVGQPFEAERAAKRLFALEPDFQAKRKQLLSGLLFDAKKVEMIDSVLKKAGI